MKERIEGRIAELSNELQQAINNAIARDVACVSLNNQIFELKNLLKEEGDDGTDSGSKDGS